MSRDEPMAWYEWAHSELERGHGEMADVLARRAGEIPGSDRSDLLDLRAAAAWQRGDPEAFEAHLETLAKEAPMMARGLVVDLGVDTSRLGSRVLGLLDGPAREEGLDGYA